jgi:hypothetical protein
VRREKCDELEIECEYVILPVSLLTYGICESTLVVGSG